MKNKDIGQLLKELRLKHGLTQAELAKRVNVTYQAVSRWEKGNNTPNLDTLVELSKVYNLSVDELVLQATKKIEIVPHDYVPHWFFRFFIIPMILMALSFGISQFYLFLNVLYGMIVLGIFIGFVLSLVMIFIRVRNRGYFFACALGIILLVNGTIYFTNQNFYHLTEVPYLQEIERLSVGEEYINQHATHIRFTYQDEPYVLAYYKGSSNIQIYQLNSELSSMMEEVNTQDIKVMSVVIIDETVYFSSYEFGGTTSSIYSFDLEDKEVNLLYEANQRFDLIKKDSEIYLVVLGETTLDFYSAIYKWDGSAPQLVKELNFEIVDILYNDSVNNFYISVIRNDIEEPGTFGNILIYDDSLTFQSRLFDEYVPEMFYLVNDGMRVISSFDHEIIRIHIDEVEYTGLYGDPYYWHNSGLDYILHGDIIDSSWNTVTQTIFYTSNWRPGNTYYIYWRENTNQHIAIGNGEISLLQGYSRQTESILIPLNIRFIAFVGVMPFLALFITLGTKVTYQPKIKKTKVS